MKPFWKHSQKEASAGTRIEQEAGGRIICLECNTAHEIDTAWKKFFVCRSCGNYMFMSPKERLAMVLDDAVFEPWFEDIGVCNPLGDLDYPWELSFARAKTGSTEAFTIGYGRIGGHETVIGACESRFMAGSMGRAMGEKITLAFERATERKLPVILFCCGGSERMQEGIISLMQMEKTTAAMKRHSDAGLFYCSVLTNSMMAGVSAGFSMLADVVLAEAQARIGFTAPEAVQQLNGQIFPAAFQTPQFQLEHGMVDRIVERHNLKNALHYLLYIHSSPCLKNDGNKEDPLENEKEESQYPAKTPWEKVGISRSGGRASPMDYIERIFEDFRELHGDRCFGDDHALIGGLAFLDGKPVTILANLSGNSMYERIYRNFAMPKPEGYRKAVRLMKQAEKFGRPVIVFVNTSGAFCGVDAEERGQSTAVAESIMVMSGLKVPTLCILVGEGYGSGALAISIGNEVWMLEHSTYSISSPERYAAVRWKTGERAEDAAQLMKLTAQELAELKIIERIIPEFGGAADETVDRISKVMRHSIREFIKRYGTMSPGDIVNARYERFRKF